MSFPPTEGIERVLTPHLHRLETRMDLGSTEAIVQGAAEGLGVACVSRHAVADMVALGRLVVLRTGLPPLTRSFYLVQHERRRPSPTLERFIACCLGDPRKRGRR